MEGLNQTDMSCNRSKKKKKIIGIYLEYATSKSSRAAIISIRKTVLGEMRFLPKRLQTPASSGVTKPCPSALLVSERVHRSNSDQKGQTTFEINLQSQTKLDTITPFQNGFSIETWKWATCVGFGQEALARPRSSLTTSAESSR